MNNKLLLTSISILVTILLIFFISAMIAFIYANKYEELVQYFFKLFNGENIQFLVPKGKSIRFGGGGSFMYSFSVYTSLTVLLLYYSSWEGRLKIVLLSIVLFFSITMLISMIDSFRLVAECPDGVKRLYKGDIPYKAYFVITLTINIILIGWYSFKMNHWIDKLVAFWTK